jgi:hypothetical protein
MGAIDMDADLALVPSSEQDEFRPVIYSSLGGFGWFLGSVLVIWWVGRRRARNEDRRAAA